jgi:hypothetical protein
MSLEKLGTIAFRADHEDADWLTNNKVFAISCRTASVTPSMSPWHGTVPTSGSTFRAN